MSFDPYDTLVALTYGLGVMAILAVAFGSVERRLHGVHLRSSVHGLLSGLGAILVMLEPVRFENGLAFDARAIIVGIAAAFAGWPAALIAATIGVAYRLHVGGLGASAGAAGIVLAASLGTIWARTFRPEGRVGLRALAGLGAMLALYTLNVFLLPPSVVWTVLTSVVPVLAVSCIAGAIVMGSLIERERLYIRRERYWKDSAYTDAMTGLPNRRWFQEVLAALPGQRRRSATDALLMVDADNFKAVNDCYGHEAGDAALVHIAGILQSETRAGDRVCRLGGEEFAVFVADTTLETAARRADDLRRAISEAIFTYDEDVVPLSVSIGAAVQTGFAEARPAALFRTADAALYAAKKGGRNRVVVANASDFAAEE